MEGLTGAGLARSGEEGSGTDTIDVAGADSGGWGCWDEGTLCGTTIGALKVGVHN